MSDDISPDSLFVTDETVTRFLFPKSEQHPAGIWVTFKRELSYGEACDVDSALITGMSTGEAEQLAREAEARAARGGRSTILVDTGRQKKLRLASWITDWNFPDRTGKTVRWPSSLPERLQVVYSLGEKVGAWLEQQIVEISGDADAVTRADPEDETSGPLPLGAGARRRGATSP